MTAFLSMSGTMSVVLIWSRNWLNKELDVPNTKLSSSKPVTHFSSSGTAPALKLEPTYFRGTNPTESKDPNSHGVNS